MTIQISPGETLDDAEIHLISYSLIDSLKLEICLFINYMLFDTERPFSIRKNLFSCKVLFLIRIIIFKMNKRYKKYTDVYYK